MPEHNIQIHQPFTQTATSGTIATPARQRQPAMLRTEHLNLRRGSDLLVRDASITLHAGWKVGLTGRNGCGKSSLLALFAGRLEPDAGQLSLPADWRIASMDQEVPALTQPAIEYVLDGHSRLRACEADLEKAQSAGDGHAIARAHAALDAIDAWTLPARAATVLAGLGFSETAQRNPVASFSGGWRMRLNLARVLLADADLLLLDEPTNHLDLDAVLWLEDWLKQFSGTLILISHDRDFLDNVAEHILHIERGELRHYRGNYSSFEQQRAAQLSQQESEYKKQVAQAEHLKKFIARFSAQANKARQAQSRVKALQKLELIAPAHVADGFQFSFPEPESLPDPMLDLDGVSCGYDGAAVLRDVRLNISPETRLGLLGPNGAGKSTLIKTLAGILPPLEGHFTRGPELVTGYFHQQQVDALPQQATPFQLMQEARPKWEESRVRSELGRFGFNGDEVFAIVERFSGGEKSRLALALLVQQHPGLLLLDEPANHLDLDMREALTLALQEYQGAVILVSHDRHLLETSVSELLLVADGTTRSWDGDLDDYARWLRDRNKKPVTEPAANDTSRQDARSRRQEAAQKREALRPLRKQMAAMEKRLDKLQARLAELESQLADESLYQESGKDRLPALLTEQGELRRDHEQQETELLAAMEQLEQLEQEP